MGLRLVRSESAVRARDNFFLIYFLRNSLYLNAPDYFFQVATCADMVHGR